jgi:hypothetical protein
MLKDEKIPNDVIETHFIEQISTMKNSTVVYLLTQITQNPWRKFSQKFWTMINDKLLTVIASSSIEH